jgi:hypothetical protein
MTHHIKFHFSQPYHSYPLDTKKCHTPRQYGVHKSRCPLQLPRLETRIIHNRIWTVSQLRRSSTPLPKKHGHSFARFSSSWTIRTSSAFTVTNFIDQWTQGSSICWTRTVLCICTHCNIQRTINKK